MHEAWQCMELITADITELVVNLLSISQELGSCETRVEGACCNITSPTQFYPMGMLSSLLRTILYTTGIRCYGHFGSSLTFVFGGNSLYNGQVQVVVQLVGLGPAWSATYRFRLVRDI